VVGYVSGDGKPFYVARRQRRHVFSIRNPNRLAYSGNNHMSKEETRPIEILLVEDSPSDTELTLEALKDFKVRNHVSVVEDGVQALAFLRRQGSFAQAPRPDLIMLDLNLPRKDGREVLADIKGDEQLKAIPIVVLTTSRADQDILRAYQLNANCYINKPVDFNQFLEVIRSIESFWLYVVTLPPAPNAGGS
jgi:two-component system, chemotaxis family, response regulator Rcp1